MLFFFLFVLWKKKAKDHKTKAMCVHDQRLCACVVRVLWIEFACVNGCLPMLLRHNICLLSVRFTLFTQFGSEMCLCRRWQRTNERPNERKKIGEADVGEHATLNRRGSCVLRSGKGIKMMMFDVRCTVSLILQSNSIEMANWKFTEQLELSHVARHSAVHVHDLCVRLLDGDLRYYICMHIMWLRLCCRIHFLWWCVINSTVADKFSYNSVISMVDATRIFLISFHTQVLLWSISYLKLIRNQIFVRILFLLSVIVIYGYITFIDRW